MVLVGSRCVSVVHGGSCLILLVCPWWFLVVLGESWLFQLFLGGFWWFLSGSWLILMVLVVLEGSLWFLVIFCVVILGSL